jgi:hypothetical protein
MNPTNSATLNVPQTQNTAPVLEFRCLYTADLRRKQKRWQDGILKFHTFNKRIMVYDERSNFIGDTHWKGSEFVEGEEFELERGHIMVEVGDCIGKRDQDLSELVDKRVKDKEDRAAARAAQATQASPIRPQTATPASEYLRPKTLNAVIGTPTGHYGRAIVSNLSPFDEKQRGNRDENTARPAKKQKQDESTSSKSSYAQNLMGATLIFSSSRPPSTTAIRYEPVRPTIQRSRANTVDLTNDEDIIDHRSSRRSPPRLQKRRTRKSPAVKSGYASSLMGAALSLSTPSDTTSKENIPAVKKDSTNWIDVDSHPSSPETFGSSDRRINLTSGTEVEHPMRQQVQKAKTAPRKHQEPPPPVPKPQHATTKEPSLPNIPGRPVSTLRIKARAPRQMMMLMELPSSRPSAQNETLLSKDISRPQRKTPIAEVVELPRIAMQRNQLYQVELPAIDPDNMSSSPVDSGIDHNTIDALLSRGRDSSGTEQSSLRPEKVTEAQATTTTIEPMVETCGLPKESVVVVKENSSEIPNLDQPAKTVPCAIEQTIPHSVANLGKDPPKLVNPATRGQSVQMLATKTVDTISLVTMNMEPPRMIDRPGKDPIRSRGADDPSLGSPVVQGGPWSRESFDLFGTWRPPGRSTITG